MRLAQEMKSILERHPLIAIMFSPQHIANLIQQIYEAGTERLLHHAVRADTL